MESRCQFCRRVTASSGRWCDACHLVLCKNARAERRAAGLDWAPQLRDKGDHDEPSSRWRSGGSSGPCEDGSPWQQIALRNWEDGA